MLKNGFIRYSTIIALLILIIGLSITTSKFLNPGNLLNILTQSAILTLVSVGLCLVIAAGGIDLSVAVAFDMGGMVSVILLSYGWGWLTAIFMGLVAGAIIGVFNSFLVLKVKITIFLATLGTLFIGQSIERIITEGGKPVYLPNMDEVFSFLGNGSLFVVNKWGSQIDFKWSVIIAILVAFSIHFLLKKTVFGRYLYAIGLQSEAAELSGVPVKKYTSYAFVICSVICAFAGIVGASALKSYVPLSGNYYLMDGIGAVFIGSTLNEKGLVDIPGTLVGVIFYGVVSNGLSLVGINFYWQSVVHGLLMFAILILNSYRLSSIKKVGIA
jgi:ribose transport system permease protein